VLRNLRGLALVALVASLGCATSTAGKKYGWGGQPPAGGGGSGTVTSVSGTAPISVTNGTTTPVVSVSGIAAADLASNAVTTVKITDANVTLPKLATQADQTIVANQSGSTASPTARTMTQITAGLDPATSSLKGLQSAADKALASLQQGEWRNIMALRCKALDATLNQPRDLTPGGRVGQATTAGMTSATTYTGDAGINGGGVTGVSRYWNLGLIPDAKTMHFCAAWRVKFSASNGSAVSQVGFSNAGNSHVIVFEVPNTASGFFRLRSSFTSLSNATTTLALESSNFHDVMLLCDGSNCNAYVDNSASVGSVAASNADTELLYPYSFDNINANTFKLADSMFMYAGNLGSSANP
jgi:hypothetical protein